MSFIEAIRSCLNQYIDGSGRAMRSEYWYWVLFNVLAAVAAAIADAAIGGGLESDVQLVSLVTSLALIAPSITVGVRRLHDIGKSGWNLCWGFLPILGHLYLLWLAIKPSDDFTNEYGPKPAAEPLVRSEA